MKKTLLTLLLIFAFKLGFAQAPEIKIHSYSPEIAKVNENIELRVTLINKGDVATDNNITATLTSDSDYVTIVNGNATFGPMAADSTQEATFSIVVNELIPDGKSMFFDLEAILEGSSVESVVTYNFEYGMQGWTSIDADGDGFKWFNSESKLGPGYGHESNFCMFSQSYDNTFDILYPDNYLVTPEKFKIGKDASFSFWACAQDLEYPAEHFGVAVSTKDNTSAADFTTIKEWTMTAKGTREQGNWYQYTVDLNEYEGQELWIAIRHFNCFDEYYLAVDDVQINNILKPRKWNDRFLIKSDNPVPEIAVTTIEHDDIIAGSDLNINVTFFNKSEVACTYDTRAILSTKDEYVTIKEGESILGTMASNETLSRTFVVSIDEDIPEKHTIDLNVSVIPNEITGNSTSFTYRFEKDFNGWTTIDANNDAHTWYHTTQIEEHFVVNLSSHSGHGHLMSESSCNLTMEAIKPDDYVVSPSMIGVTENTSFSVWACNQDKYYFENFGLAVSTKTYPSANDFTTIAEWEINDNRAASPWKEYTVDLSKYAGQHIWVAIRHFKSEDQFILCIDDISINNFVNCQKWSHNFSLNIDKTSLTEENISFNIYPNPVNDKLYIETLTQTQTLTQTLTIEIYDVYGRHQVAEIPSLQGDLTIDVSELNSGIYFVKVKTNEGNIVKRIVKL